MNSNIDWYIRAIDNTEETIEKASNYTTGIVGTLVKLKSKLKVEKDRLLLAIILAFFMKNSYPYVYLASHFPDELYNDIVLEFKTPYYILSEVAKMPEIKKEIDKLIIRKRSNRTNKIKKING